MSDELNCPVEGDNVIEHEAHRKGKAPKVAAPKKIKGLFGLSPCAIPGVSLTNYNVNAQQKGWGGPCTGARTTVTLSTSARVTVRSEIAELSRLVLEEVIRRGYFIRPADTGAYNCRYISGTTVWSNHAWALAIDINWQSNPYTSPRRTDMPGWMPALFNRYGFAWGGDYTGSQDSMHYEFMGTPAQAAAALALAQQELTGGPTPTPIPTPAPDPTPSADVEQIKRDQFNLNDTGFTCDVDGVWGPASIQAAKNFQYSAHLPADGIMGPVTRAALAKVPSWRGPYDGDGGHAISVWQQKLKDHGWRIEVDNVWGAHSASIMRQYQTEKQLAVTGNGNPQVWTSLYCTTN